MLRFVEFRSFQDLVSCQELVLDLRDVMILVISMGSISIIKYKHCCFTAMFVHEVDAK